MIEGQGEGTIERPGCRLKVSYSLTLPLPPDPTRDAVTREIALLRKSFGGELGSLARRGRHSRFLPHRWSGLGRSRDLEAIDRVVDVHHVFGPGSRLPKVLTRLEKPVIYSVTDRVSHRFDPPAGSVRAISVARLEDRRRLREAGWPVVEVVEAGIALERFPPRPLLSLDPEEPMTLMAGSAPWTRRQFKTKGFDALLDLASRDSKLRLVLLWRGVLEPEIERQLRRRSLADRVEVMHQTVDVGELLGRCHAAVVVAASDRVVRPYPHSLIEALASGRPIVVSHSLEISRLIQRSGAGRVIEDGSSHLVERLATAVQQLRNSYRDMQLAARQLDLSPFAAARYVERFRRLYETVCERPVGPEATVHS